LRTVSPEAPIFAATEQIGLVELLTPTLQHGPGRFVAVVGPSGSGKSSLLHAGLLPRLAGMPERWLVVPPLRPGRQPTTTLTGGLVRAFATRGYPRPTNELAAVLARGSAGLVKLAGELADLGANGAGRPGVLIVIDQAEELLILWVPETLCSPMTCRFGRGCAPA
jgi:energy-coupling factor transporter ATP-binding protein EcfA2